MRQKDRSLKTKDLIDYCIVRCFLKLVVSPFFIYFFSFWFYVENIIEPEKYRIDDQFDDSNKIE